MTMYDLRPRTLTFLEVALPPTTDTTPIFSLLFFHNARCSKVRIGLKSICSQMLNVDLRIHKRIFLLVCHDISAKILSFVLITSGSVIS